MKIIMFAFLLIIVASLIGCDEKPLKCHSETIGGVLKVGDICQ